MVVRPAHRCRCRGRCTFSGPNPVDRTVSCTDDGTYTLTLTASDGTDARSDNMVLTVTNRAPVLALLTPVRDQTFAPLAAVALHATIVDQGTNDTETCSIDWGDGTTSIGVVSPAALAGQWFCDGSHGFAGDLTAFNVRAFTIKVAATDDDNGTDTRNVSVEVDLLHVDRHRRQRRARRHAR